MDTAVRDRRRATESLARSDLQPTPFPTERMPSRLVQWCSSPLGLLGLIVIGQLPLLGLHIHHLMSSPHYQFVAALPLGCLALYWQRKKDLAAAPDLEGGGSATARLVMLGLLGGLFLAEALAIYLWSPWVAAVCSLGFYITLSYLLAGPLRLRTIAPAWVLACLMVPLPLHLDTQLTVALRGMATAWSSHVLDTLGVLHLISGNVIVLADRSLFVADACSGINSLFALLAMAMFLGLWLRRPALHIGLLVILALPIVLIENVLRIVLVGTTAAWFNLDLSEGWQHGALGAGLFALSSLLLLSADQLLLGFHPLRARWTARAHSRNLASERLHGEHGESQPSTRGIAAGWLLATSATLLLLSGTVQAALVPHRVRSPAEFLALRPLNVPELSAEDLPAQLGNWSRVSFEATQRSTEDPFGAHSQAWVYRNGSLLARVSIDHPFRRVHDLTICYSSIGWNIINREINQSNMPYVEATMDRPRHGNGYLLFSLHNREGRSEAHIERPLETRFGARLEDAGPWFQIQLLHGSSAPVKPADRAELAQLFSTARNLLCSKVLESTSDAPPP